MDQGDHDVNAIENAIREAQEHANSDAEGGPTLIAVRYERRKTGRQAGWLAARKAGGV